MTSMSVRSQRRGQQEKKKKSLAGSQPTPLCPAHPKQLHLGRTRTLIFLPAVSCILFFSPVISGFFSPMHLASL